MAEQTVAEQTFRLIGQDFTPPDIRAKVTGAAKYSEDFRMDGMAYVKMLLSPMPHCRVARMTADAALALPGVYGILTAEDVPQFPQPGEQILNNAPNFVGEPILAIAAVDEATASAALELIEIEYEALPFTLDPLESLYPGGPNANQGGNLVTAGSGEGEGGNGQLVSRKWTARDFAAVEPGQLPMGEAFIDWSYGDVDAAFANAALVLDETWVTASNSHHSMEPRSAFSYWENGKCFLYGSTQSQSFIVPPLAGMIGIAPTDLVYIAEFCGGGFGSKGGAYALMALPAHFSKKIGRPCMLRVTRAEEYYLGSARAGFQGRVKMGFSADGRMTACDLYIVQQNGAKAGFGDYSAGGEAMAIVYTPENMRFRAIPIGTNTPPCGPQRGPGQNQIAMAMEPLLDKAAKQLGIDQLAIRKINAPNHDSLTGASRQKVSSAYVNECLDLGAQRFDWAAKLARSGETNGPKVIGVGIGQAYHGAGFAGFDGLVKLTPEGKLVIHTGVGNLGTYSYASTARVAAEVLGMNWENCTIERGDSSKHLPWNIGQFGSNTSFTMTRTNYAAAMDAKRKLQEIAAMDLGGAPEDYELADETVFATADNTKRMTFAAAAQRAIELGGKYSGQEVSGVNVMTSTAAAGIAGTGLIGVARDNLPFANHVATFTVSYAMIELDRETGQFDILEYVSTADCGKVMHPKGLSGQIRGGSVMGVGMARSERVVYDPQNGLPANVGFHQAKPPTYLDMPSIMDVAAVDLPDPDCPVGTKGVGEPPTGAAAAAILCAISDALGGVYFKRNPVTPDMIVNAVAGRDQSHQPLQINTQ